MISLDKRQVLIDIAAQHISTDDPSHDLAHCLRVLDNCEYIATMEGGDTEILVPAALLHDVVNPPKNHPDAHLATDKSAALAAEILQTLDRYPKHKIDAVMYAIKHCSYSKNLPHDTLESQILQDADFLESTGAIAIMRTFCSTGQFNRPFMDMHDPFAENREPDGKAFALDLFPTRLLKIYDKMLTQTGKKLARDRHTFLQAFYEQVRKELSLQ